MATDDKKKKKLTDEEVTRTMQDMLHGGEPRQFGQPVGGGFQSGEVENRSDQGGQSVPSETNAPEKYDVDWLLSQYDAMQRDDEAEARRQKSRDMVNGIADMARAIGDLYHTDRYAPSQEVNKNLMSEVSRKRYDKAKAERDKRRAEYLHYVNNVANQQNAEEGNRLRAEANRLRERQLDQQAEKDKEMSEYRNAKLDFEKAQKAIENALKEEGLNMRERIARMNNATRQMTTNQRATLISPYKEWTEVEEKGGKKTTIKYRLTIDPITGEIKGEELVGANKGKKNLPNTNTGKKSLPQG